MAPAVTRATSPSPAGLLWAHQIKREHGYLVERLRTLEDRLSQHVDDATAAEKTRQEANAALEARIAELSAASGDAVTKRIDDARDDVLGRVQELRAEVEVLEAVVTRMEDARPAWELERRKALEEQVGVLKRLGEVEVKVQTLDAAASAVTKKVVAASNERESMAERRADLEAVVLESSVSSREQMASLEATLSSITKSLEELQSGQAALKHELETMKDQRPLDVVTSIEHAAPGMPAERVVEQVDGTRSRESTPLSDPPPSIAGNEHDSANTSSRTTTRRTVVAKDTEVPKAPLQSGLLQKEEPVPKLDKKPEVSEAPKTAMPARDAKGRFLRKKRRTRKPPSKSSDPVYEPSEAVQDVGKETTTAIEAVIPDSSTLSPTPEKHPPAERKPELEVQHRMSRTRSATWNVEDEQIERGVVTAVDKKSPALTASTSQAKGGPTNAAGKKRKAPSRKARRPAKRKRVDSASHVVQPLQADAAKDDPKPSPPPSRSAVDAVNQDGHQAHKREEKQEALSPAKPPRSRRLVKLADDTDMAELLRLRERYI